MMNPAIGQGREALQAPYVQEYIQSGSGTGTHHVSVAGKVRMIAQIAGALISLAVIFTGAWWGYKQIMRDLHGVPVVKALDGPMRIAPEEPGGMVASNAGFAVNDVQAVGTAATPESQLILAPEPVVLAEEDKPTSELEPLVNTAAETEQETLELATQSEADDSELIDPTPRSATLASLAEDVPEDDQLGRALALADAAAEGAEPLTDPATAVTEPAEAISEVAANPEAKSDLELAIEAAVRTAAIAVPQSTLNDAPGLAASPRPAPRPGARGGATPVSASPSDVVAPKTIDASDVAAGTRLVQLGAYGSQDEAQQAWSRIAARSDGLLDNKTQVILEGQSGERRFWRLRAMGFADLAEARRFCASLLFENPECIPVVAR